MTVPSLVKDPHDGHDIANDETPIAVSMVFKWLDPPRCVRESVQLRVEWCLPCSLDLCQMLPPPGPRRALSESLAKPARR